MSVDFTGLHGITSLKEVLFIVVLLFPLPWAYQVQLLLTTSFVLIISYPQNPDIIQSEINISE
jgi:hypothetical protein